ncbi:transmembrane channel-like protein 6b [Betta splendens]|uniref:Transmembrane channel-like protein n=1 Tax=Betta splendens TaxID=158456 RepID=A0A6P7MDN8_BETSP|nr:transmembrane channel-like protein 6b [Betta splendens]
MAHNVNFNLNDLHMDAVLESPVDEEVVHDSFNQLIAEQSQDEGQYDAFELQQLQRDLDEEGRDDVAYLSSPGYDFEDQNEDWDSDERLTDPLVDERWSSDTLKILSSMPSRTIGRSRGAIISQYYNRTLQLRRRRQSRPSIRDFSRSARPSILGYGIETDSCTYAIDAKVSKKEQLVNNLRNLAVGDRVRMLREMPLSMSDKSDLRKSVLDRETQIKSSKRVTCCSDLKICVLSAVRRGWYSWLSFLHSLHLWQVALKRVGGRFGTGVLSYFVFLKTLLFFNLFLFLVTGTFLVLPQAVHSPVSPTENRTFKGLELVTGAGYFSDTVMYYGYYCNDTLRMSGRNDARGHIMANGTKPDCVWNNLSYNMPLAYFFTIGMALFFTCIILVYSMSKSFGQSFRIDKSQSILAMKVFCSWDFRVVRESSVKLMSDNICTQIKELLAEVKQGDTSTTVCQKLWRMMVHGVAWTICIAATIGSVFAIYYFSDYIHQDLQQLSRNRNANRNPLLDEAKLLALPVVVSLINMLLPGLFNLVAWMEEYDSPSTYTYISLSRNLMLKVSVLGILCYHWLGRVAADPQSIGLTCWESFVGQELYRFLLMDFIFTALDSLFGEFLWRLFSEKVLKRRRKPEFDIARNVLELIYGQTLAWVGVLFTPLLPAVQIIKLWLLFYIKMGSVMINCQAPRKPYRVSQMTTIFITLLCFPSFLGASVCVTYTMWSITPSSSCGPFRGLKTMIQAGKHLMEKLEKDNPKLSVLARAHAFLVENPLFLFVGAGIFLIVIYFHSQVVDGQRTIISLLQRQIENEGEDKKFLITSLQSIHENKRTQSRRPRRQDSNC